MSLAESVRQRLLNLAHKNAEPFDLVLTRYGLERLLYRISKSKWKKKFLLKGAMLFSLWSDTPHRSTKDLDLMIFGNADVQFIKKLFQAICNMKVVDDGVRFVPETEKITFPTLLEFPAPKIRSYSMYTVVAEKFQAMVSLGFFNSRMKDFFDLRVMAGKFEFSGAVLCSAITSTFDRRKTELPLKTPVALTNTFANDKLKISQWDAFLLRNRLELRERSLARTVEFLRRFLMPVVRALARKNDFICTWPPGGPWK